MARLVWQLQVVTVPCSWKIWSGCSANSTFTDQVWYPPRHKELPPKLTKTKILQTRDSMVTMAHMWVIAVWEGVGGQRGKSSRSGGVLYSHPQPSPQPPTSCLEPDLQCIDVLFCVCVEPFLCICWHTQWIRTHTMVNIEVITYSRNYAVHIE